MKAVSSESKLVRRNLNPVISNTEVNSPLIVPTRLQTGKGDAMKFHYTAHQMAAQKALVEILTKTTISQRLPDFPIHHDVVCRALTNPEPEFATTFLVKFKAENWKIDVFVEKWETGWVPESATLYALDLSGKANRALHVAIFSWKDRGARFVCEEKFVSKNFPFRHFSGDLYILD